jgi:hypothetical protein
MKTQRERVHEEQNLQLQTAAAAAKPAREPELPASLLITEPQLEQIRERAYQLYEERGRIEGFAEEDWLQAEAEILMKSGKLAA